MHPASLPDPADWRSLNVAHAQVHAIGSPGTDFRDLPDGTVHLGWNDWAGNHRRAEVVQWLRLDRFGLTAGIDVLVEISARARRDIRSPMHYVSGRIRMTGHVDNDHCDLYVGDPANPGSWVYGVKFFGATLLEAHTSVL